MRALAIYSDGSREDVQGRTVASIARTHFGRDAVTARLDVDDCGVGTWTVTRGPDIVGQIATRPPGRPIVHPEARDRGVLVRCTETEREALREAAEAAGQTVNDYVLARVLPSG